MKYGGVFNKTKLIDAIQSVDGVEDVVYHEAIPTIKYCAITEDYDGLTVKVNKEGYEILTKEEMASFSAYMGFSRTSDFSGLLILS